MEGGSDAGSSAERPSPAQAQLPLQLVAAQPSPLATPSAGLPAALKVYNTYRYGFDHVYGPDSEQEEVYAQSARSAVLNVLDGGRAGGRGVGQRLRRAWDPLRAPWRCRSLLG